MLIPHSPGHRVEATKTVVVPAGGLRWQIHVVMDGFVCTCLCRVAFFDDMEEATTELGSADCKGCCMGFWFSVIFMPPTPAGWPLRFPYKAEFCIMLGRCTPSPGSFCCTGWKGPEQLWFHCQKILSSPRDKTMLARVWEPCSSLLPLRSRFPANTGHKGYLSVSFFTLSVEASWDTWSSHCIPQMPFCWTKPLRLWCKSWDGICM